MHYTSRSFRPGCETNFEFFLIGASLRILVWFRWCIPLRPLMLVLMFFDATRRLFVPFGNWPSFPLHTYLILFSVFYFWCFIISRLSGWIWRFQLVSPSCSFFRSSLFYMKIQSLVCRIACVVMKPPIRVQITFDWCLTNSTVEPLGLWLISTTHRDCVTNS